MLRRLPLLDGPAHLEAVHARQHQVEDDQIRLGLLDASEGGFAVVCRDHLEPGLLQVVADDIEYVGLVLDDEDTLSHVVVPLFVTAARARPHAAA